MGGLVPALGEALARKAEGSAVGETALSLLGNKEWELDLTPQGKPIKEMLSRYKEINTASLARSTKHIDDLQEYHKNTDAVRNSLPLNTASIKDIAQHPAPKPPAVRQAIIELHRINPDYMDHTIPRVTEMIKGQARLDGITGSFGDKMQNLSPLIANMLEHPDPRVQTNGRRLLDIVSNELTDTRPSFNQGKINVESGVKADVAADFQKVNKLRERAGLTEARLPAIDVRSTYTSPTKTEKILNNAMRVIQIPFVAVPHVGQYFHLPASSASLEALGKGLLKMDRANMDRTIEASGILAHTQWDIIYSDLLARTGRIAKWTNSPTAASILSKTIHQPLFNWLRLKQLSVAGSVGFHSAIFWAENAMKGDKASLARLEELGINFADVVRQGGRLNEDQLAKGVYHFVNNRFFFDRSIDNSLYQNKNFFMRSAFMYHSFISSETAYIGRELRLMVKAGDIKGLARFVGTLGIAFPVFAPVLKSTEILLRTGSPTQAGQNLKKDYGGLLTPSSPGEWVGTYLDMLAHLGAMGAAYNYTNAIKANRLANAVVGPMIGMGLTDIEDAWNAAVLGKSAKPLGRDVTQMIPVIGKPLSHHLFPTTKEEKGDKTSTRHSRTRRAGRRR